MKVFAIAGFEPQFPSCRVHCLVCYSSCLGFYIVSVDTLLKRKEIHSFKTSVTISLSSCFNIPEVFTYQPVCILEIYSVILIAMKKQIWQPSTLSLLHLFLLLVICLQVVELKASQEYQACTLFLLLKLVQSDSELFSQFVNQDCHKLLLKVMQSPRCIAGHHMLKVGNRFLHANDMLVPKIQPFLSQALYFIIPKCPII